MTGSRRVWITGAGTVNALGPDAASTWAALAAGRGAIGPLDVAGLDRLSVRIGAAVRDWSLSAPLLALDPGMDRATAFALQAAEEAVGMAGLPAAAGWAATAAIVLGTSGGGHGTWDAAARAVYAEGRPRVHPLTVPRLMANAPASLIARRHAIEGPVLTISTACASANHALGLAFRMVRSGDTPVALAGGSEAMLNFGGLKAWEGLRVLAPDACRPFCATRSGMVMGEGAAVLVLEEAGHAAARGAVPLAELAGFAMTSDAGDAVAPSGSGAARAMAGALADAGVSAEAIGYVNAHGTATRVNDRAETAALRQVFGDRLDRLPVSSTKAMHGHAIGATGAIEALACLLALRDGILAPTIGHREADPDCPPDVVANVARRADIGAALSNAFAFGGLNAVLAFRRV